MLGKASHDIFEKNSVKVEVFERVNDLTYFLAVVQLVSLRPAPQLRID
jgi:hypothetical protein